MIIVYYISTFMPKEGTSHIQHKIGYKL